MFLVCPSGSQPGILYGLGKIHKPCKNGVPPFRPILSAIGKPTYSLAKFLIPILSEIAIAMNLLLNILSVLLMKKAYKILLFTWLVLAWTLFSLTSLSLYETMDICINELFPDPDSAINGIARQDFRKLLELSTTESFFIFNGCYYKQIDGVAMGSPL